MKKLFLILLLTTSAAAANAAEIVESIVARVGDRIITRTQYLARLGEGYSELEKGDRATLEQRKADYRKTLLDNMIGELLIKDRADRIGITVSNDELQDSIQRLKREYNLRTDEEFENSLRSSGLTRSEMEARLKESLLTQKVLARELRSRAELTDRELRERYDREKERFRRPERARLREIVIGADAAGIADASARAVQIAARAKQGEDFAKLATEFSTAPTKEQGGSLGEIAKGELLEALDAAVFAASSGDVVGPIQTRAGFHILKVEEKFPSELPAFESVKDQIRKDLSDDAYARDFKAYLDRLRKEAYIDVNDENIPTV